MPSLELQTPNPRINFTTAHRRQRECPRLAGRRSPRRAGVSSFGVGVRTAHVVLEEASAPTPSGPSRTHQIVLVSAKSATALETATTNLARHIDAHPDIDLADVAFTTQVGRRAFGYRRALVAERSEAAAAARALATVDGERVMTGTPASSDRPLAFMFSGQGTQYVNMGRDLYRDEAAFRAIVDDCCDRLLPHLGFDLRQVMYPDPEHEQEASARLTRTSVTQPALFTIEYATARLLMQWGLTPKAMIGHSVGEYVAACLSGVFSLDDALALVAVRGQLMEEMPAGSMLAVPLSESEARLIAQDAASLAAVNAPFLSVLSGPTADIDRIATQLAERGLHVRRLQTSHAFHSAMMEPMLERFTLAVQSIERRPPAIPFISNVTGTWISAEQAQDPQVLEQPPAFGGAVRRRARRADARAGCHPARAWARPHPANAGASTAVQRFRTSRAGLLPRGSRNRHPTSLSC